MLEETLVKWRDNIIREDRQKVLLDLMTARFGRLPEETRRRLENITSLKQLERLTRRVLSAKSLEDMRLR